MNYPTAEETLPSVKILLGMLLRKQPPQTALALKHAWTVQGYLQGLLLGEPVEGVTLSSIDEIPEVPPGSRTIHAVSMDASGKVLLDELKSLHTYLEGVTSAPEGQVQMASLSGTLIGLSARYLLPILLQWMMDWAANGGLDKLLSQMPTQE